MRAEDLKYFAKIEHERTYRGYEKQVLENVPYRKEIARLRNKICMVEPGEIKGNVSKLQKKIDQQIEQAPHKQNGKMIAVGMKKQGHQTHVHIIVSRRDTVIDIGY